MRADYDSAELDVVADVSFASPDGEKVVPSVIYTGAFSIWMDMNMFNSIVCILLDYKEG